MSVKRIFAVTVIFCLACAGWAALGMTTSMRSGAFAGRLGKKVEALWGAPLLQQAPSFSVETSNPNRTRWLMPVEQNVKVTLKKDYRKKGLLWYPTYTSTFEGVYFIENPEKTMQKVQAHFDFPEKNATYSDFDVSLKGEKLNHSINTSEGVTETIELQPGEKVKFRIAYHTRGIYTWRYRLDPKAGRAQNFDLQATTDFMEVDYPEGCLSPTENKKIKNGMLLSWKSSDLISREDIGIIIPGKLNPGPLTSRITFFAPCCLVFFFVLVETIGILYKIKIHPMHYLFVTAGFFSFHLLLAYMAGLIDINLAFLIAAIVSIGLVTGYLSAALRGSFPWKIAVAGHFFFLVLFSYSFFFQGITGLTVAIGSVITLAVLMRVTAHVDWEEVFKKPSEETAKTEPASPEAPAFETITEVQTAPPSVDC